MVVDALLFDVFGTVVDWRASIVREVRDFAARMELDLDADAFADAWRGLYQPYMERVRSGAEPWTPLDDLHLRSLQQLLAEGEINDLSEEAVVDLSLAWRRLDPWPESPAALHRLRERYVVAPVSNGNVALMVHLARHAGLTWDAILGAEPARAYKPDPAVYRTAAALLRLPPERCLMVAAHNGDLRAAGALGFRTAFVHRPREFGPERPGETPDGDYDLVASDLAALADRLPD
jgi:2-haloacid dehalogenase